MTVSLAIALGILLDIVVAVPLTWTLPHQPPPATLVRPFL